MNHLLLDDRVLWEDGSISVPSDIITKYINVASSGKLFTDEITPEIAQFNKMATRDKRITIKKKLDPLSTEWLIPSDITSINIKEFLDDRLYNELVNGNFTEDEEVARVERLEFEYAELMKAELSDLIYAILYVINRFEANKIVWGVGRGSSTASYLLYILGIHDIDSVEYDLDFSEFLH